MEPWIIKEFWLPSAASPSPAHVAADTASASAARVRVGIFSLLAADAAFASRGNRDGAARHVYRRLCRLVYQRVRGRVYRHVLYMVPGTILTPAGSGPQTMPLATGMPRRHACQRRPI